MHGDKLGDKLKKAREARGLSLYRLAEITGIGASLLSKWERDLIVPRAQNIEKLARGLMVNPDLLRGWFREERERREFGQSSADEQENPGSTPDGVIASMVYAEVGHNNEASYGTQDGRADGRAASQMPAWLEAWRRVDLPHYGQVGCGPLRLESEYTVHMESVPLQYLQGEDPALLLTLEATGDSMIDADIRPGDLLLVRRQSHAKAGDVVIANIAPFGAVCKRVRKTSHGYTLVSESPTPADPIPLTDEVKIIGRVLRAWKERAF